MASTWNVLNWNIRGLNDPKKWTALHNKIEESNCSILCLQETKREHFDNFYIKNFCPKSFNKFDFVPSVGASAGLLVALNDHLFSGHTVSKNDFSITISFTSKHNGEQWYLTNVYGPCQQAERVIFINWFQILHMQDEDKWLILGDFNYSRYPQSRNREGGNIQDMFAFHEAISQLALVEIPLKGRNFTWSNMQEAPVLEKLDWFFTSEFWTLAFPDTTAIPLAKTTSDHVPVMIKIGTSIPRATIFRFENLWLERHDFKEVVKNVWDQQVQEVDSAKVIAPKFKRLRKGLKIWASKFSDLKQIIMDTNYMIHFYDTLEEYRSLTTAEANGRTIIKEHLQKILS